MNTYQYDQTGALTSAVDFLGSGGTPVPYSSRINFGTYWRTANFPTVDESWGAILMNQTGSGTPAFTSGAQGMDRPGSLTGFGVQVGGSVSPGTVTLTLYKNGVATIATLSTAQTTGGLISMTLPSGTIKFVKGDYFECKIRSTSASTNQAFTAYATIETPT